MDATIARVESLSYEYPGTRALDAVSFALGRGSVTALVGPNGAGNTTLLRCLAGSVVRSARAASTTCSPPAAWPTKHSLRRGWPGSKRWNRAIACCSTHINYGIWIDPDFALPGTDHPELVGE